VTRVSAECIDNVPLPTLIVDIGCGYQIRCRHSCDRQFNQ
jgi:hypothetical protein